MPARPFLKWAGGKSQLLPELSRRIPERFGRYHEPFVGGGALFFYLWNHNRLQRGAILSDLNPELIDCYRAVRDQVEDLIELLQSLRPYATDRDFFYEIRAWDRQPAFAQRPLVERAARTIFLNRTCYNGLYRLNNKGQFNAPFGYYKNPQIVDSDNLREVSRALRHAELRVADFAAVLDQAQPGDFIYFDPPYVPVSSTASFTSYTRRGFDEAEQRRLAAVFHQLAERNCYVMLSNSSTTLAHQLYAKAREVDVVLASRKINCDGKRRGLVEELIACSFPTGALARYNLASD
ncbi:DNA adenine methylase [Chloroflexus sp.]|uniref:DNA adenine methylase n=1 Tax=Chloroflexus sp. TaxID=1904827 RepID=UPI00298F00C4|nr:DNA adenine methylase [Chloroflexus sp.]MCS6888773.1 DNA adenine methylase [Chloroflexus sp.]MDW8404626.1 DNA adenine methylase [Chloroflexus sp.]